MVKFLRTLFNKISDLLIDLDKGSKANLKKEEEKLESKHKKLCYSLRLVKENCEEDLSKLQNVIDQELKGKILEMDSGMDSAVALTTVIEMFKKVGNSTLSLNLFDQLKKSIIIAKGSTAIHRKDREGKYIYLSSDVDAALRRLLENVENSRKEFQPTIFSLMKKYKSAVGTVQQAKDFIYKRIGEIRLENA